MKLMLIRHGLSAGNAEGRVQGHFDSPLTELGREQARALARRRDREEWPLSAIYASDLSRSVETAEILAGGMDLPVVQDPRLREYDFGVLNGVTWGDIESLYPEVWQAHQMGSPWPALPGEEGDNAFHDRLAKALADVIAGHRDDEAVAVVSHGGSLGMMMVHFLGMKVRRRPTPFYFDNTALSVVELGARGLVLRRLNDSHHLDGDLR